MYWNWKGREEVSTTNLWTFICFPSCSMVAYSMVLDAVSPLTLCFTSRDNKFPDFYQLAKGTRSDREWRRESRYLIAFTHIWTCSHLLGCVLISTCRGTGAKDFQSFGVGHSLVLNASMVSSWFFTIPGLEFSFRESGKPVISCPLALSVPFILSCHSFLLCSWASAL